MALPLAKQGIAATGILSFIFSWNNFLFSLIIAGFKTRTLPIPVYNFLSYEEINWGGLKGMVQAMEAQFLCARRALGIL